MAWILDDTSNGHTIPLFIEQPPPIEEKASYGWLIGLGASGIAGFLMR